MAKCRAESVGVAVMTVLSIAGLIALLAGGSWYSFKVTSNINGSTQYTASLYLEKYVLTSASGSSNSTVSYSDIDKATALAHSIVSSATATNCVSSGQTAMGLTIANLALHAVFLALFVAKGGSMSDTNFRNAATGCLFIGLVLQVAAVAYFDSNNSCAKYIFNNSSGLGTTATLTAAA
jgi:hypothetical protein